MHRSSSKNRLIENYAGTSHSSYSSNTSEFSGSYSNSDLANWEEYVNEDGQLFYAEYSPFKGATQSPSSSLRVDKKSEATGSKRSNHQHQQQQQQSKQKKIQSHFKHSAIKNASNFKELDLVITAADRYRFGRRSSAAESILGFRVVPFADRPEFLMVESFVHDMPAMQQGTDQQVIKRGDWFKSLDTIEVRAENIDGLLLQFIQPTKVTLKFQGPPENPQEVHATEMASEFRKIENFEIFSQTFEKFYESFDLSSDDAATSVEKSPDQGIPFGLLILPLELSCDNSNQSIFFYPDDQESNFLYKARGSFSTLNALLTQEFKSPPILSVLVVNGVEYYVSYRTLNQVLIVCAFSALVQTRKEATLRTDEFFNYLQFTYPNLRLPFVDADGGGGGGGEQNKIRKTLLHSCDIARCRVNPPGRPRVYLFEELMKESRQMALPKEAQLRIFDALSEMEAMDYRNWNNEPLNTYREFFIFGSVLYYDCYLLASQMPVEVRLSVESFLRCRGIFDFFTLQNVKEFYVWQEIQLPQASGRYFLTICGREHLLLAVILKTCDPPAAGAPPSSSDAAAGETSEAAAGTGCVIPPSLFYIEEIEETLDHLIQCGIESLATFWSASNKRPEIGLLVSGQYGEGVTGGGGGGGESEKDQHRSKHETLKRQKSSSSLTMNAASCSSSQQHRRRSSISYDEDTHQCMSSSLGGGSSIHSLTPSEDDSSKRRGGGAAAAASGGAIDDSDSGSDWEGFGDQCNLLHPNGEGIPQMTESLWKEIKNVVPVNLSAGWKNSLCYYIYVDISNGTIFSPLKPNNESFQFLGEMRQSFYFIHDILQETKNLRCPSSPPAVSTSSSPSSSGKENFVVKEHGITIQIDENPENPSQISGEFTIIGRLFLSPPREVYICHRSDVPQNMVEMAFRLSFLGVG